MITTPTPSSLVRTTLYVPHFSWSKVTSSLARCSRCIVQIDSSTLGADPAFSLIGGSDLWFGIPRRTDHLRVPSQNLIMRKGTARFNKKSISWIVICDPAILWMQNFQVQTNNKKEPSAWWGRVRTPPRSSHWIRHCTSNGYGDWQATTHKLVLKPKVCFRVIHLMEPQRNVGMAIPRLKCKIKYKSVPPLPVSAAFFVV